LIKTAVQGLSSYFQRDRKAEANQKANVAVAAVTGTSRRELAEMLKRDFTSDALSISDCESLAPSLEGPSEGPSQEYENRGSEYDYDSEGSSDHGGNSDDDKVR
jgi:hypothetical protein